MSANCKLVFFDILRSCSRDCNGLGQQHPIVLQSLPACVVKALYKFRNLELQRLEIALGLGRAIRLVGPKAVGVGKEGWQ